LNDSFIPFKNSSLDDFEFGNTIINATEEYKEGNLYTLISTDRNIILSSIWLEKEIDLVNGFQTNFDYDLGGTDGFAFVVLANNNYTAIGDGSNSLGYSGIPQSLAVEFDFKYDLLIDGIASAPHISIQSNGIGANSVNTNYSLGHFYKENLRSYHSVLIQYSNQKLLVYIDDFETPILELTKDLSCYLNSATASLGFTASQFDTSDTHRGSYIYYWNVKGFCNGECDPGALESCNDKKELPLYVYILIAIGALLLLIIIALLVYRKLFYKSDDYSSLPPEIRWNYELFIRTKSEWFFRDNNRHFSKALKRGTEDWQRVLNLFKTLGGKGVDIHEIHVLYNPTLMMRFVHSRDLLDHKFQNENDVHFKASWLEKDEQSSQKSLRENVYKEFTKFVNSFPWNQESMLPIIPVIHVTAWFSAWQIASSGFAALSRFDDGYYGKGIYFTTNAVYSLIYFSRNQKPGVIISYILPGNTYPVIEDPNGNSSLLGRGISPYHSNFVLCQLDGMPCTE